MYMVVLGTDLEFLLWKSFRHPIINLSTSIYSDKLTVHAAGRELQFTARIYRILGPILSYNFLAWCPGGTDLPLQIYGTF